jgi:hypothetical protein
MMRRNLRLLEVAILSIALVVGVFFLSANSQRKEVFRLINTISPEAFRIVHFSTDSWLLFGKPEANWLLESAAGPMAVPSDAVLADEIDRKYFLGEMRRRFAGTWTPVGDERLMIFTRPEGEVNVCLSKDSKLMWICLLGE